jgi:phosphohistidine phosphatase SixA
MQNTADYFSHQNRRSCSNFSNQALRRNTKKPKSKWRKIFSPKCSDLMKWTVCIYISCFIAIDASGNFLELTLEEYVNNPFGNVIFLRHAFAPGMDANGEPAKFKIDDCSTQRNLDSSGRKQATIIGEKFSEIGIKFGAIYSSQWCRCLETARLLDLGEVFPDTSLNSGFKGLFNEAVNLSKLRKNLETLRNRKILILMITHQGIISGITGVRVKSGGGVAYNIKTKTSKIISVD